MMLSLDELARQPLLDDPYPHVVFENALTEIDGFNAEFPTKDQFGPTIRMDGDLTAGDPGYDDLISQSSLYGALDRQVYSDRFTRVFLELFRPAIQRAYAEWPAARGPFFAEHRSRAGRERVSGRAYVESAQSLFIRALTSATAASATACRTGEEAFISITCRA